MQHRTWITALDLSQWAPSTDAKVRIPQLLRRLVHATVDRSALERVEFPAGEQVYRPDYDGVTSCTAGNFKVPTGITYWEIGTRAHTKTKLDYDYNNRLTTRGNGDFSKVTYIAVTPHSYRDKGEWVAEKKAQGDWGDVRLYDNDDLEQWIETAPSIGVWFSQLIGKTPKGASDLSSRWELLQICLQKPLPPQLLLIGRELITKRFKDWIDGAPEFLHVWGHAPQEVIDVFTAWVESLPSTEQALIASRVVVVESQEAWRGLAHSVNRLIMIASEHLDLDETMIALARGKGHHVLVPLVNIGSKGSAVRLPRLHRNEFAAKLIEAGLAEQEAYKLAHQSGGSFSVFRRLFCNTAVKPPKWADPSVAGDWASLMLVGAWQEKSDADHEIVAKITGKTYADCTRLLNQWRTGPDSPIRLGAGIWEFVSPLDAWVFLHHALTSHVLDEFEKAADEVLGSDNPAYDLPKEDRWQAAVRGKISKYSPEIRLGLAQSLAIIATQPIPDDVVDSMPLPSRTHRVVEKLLKLGVGWQRWASLGRVLPLLAEAAPGAFMSALAADLDSDSPQTPLLFDQEASGISGRAEHAGLLWALERLALSNVHVGKATELLSRLAEKDPGGTWANRPSASLRDVFFCWMPHTTAPLDQRLTLIAGIVKKHPKIGWKLILDLLPSGSESINQATLPDWNFWAEGWKPFVSEVDQEKTTSEVVNLALSVLKSEPQKWVELIQPFDWLPFAEKEKVLTGLEAIDTSTLPELQKQPFWKALRDRILRFKFYPDAQWAPPPAMVQRLERIRDKFEPRDIVELIVPSFGNGFGMFGNRTLPWEEQEKLRQKTRSDGLQQVLDNKNYEGILELASRAPDSFGVGITLALVAEERFLDVIIPGLLMNADPKLVQFASGYLASLIGKNGIDWAEGKVSSAWTPEQTGAYSTNLPFNPRTWAFIKSKGAESNSAYWQKVRAYPMGLTAEEVADAARLLIEAKRSPTVISLLSLSTYQKNAPEPRILFDLFEAAVNAPYGANEKLEDAHDFHAILGAIYQAVDQVDETRLATIEWTLLPILDRHSLLPNGLHNLLLREPKFFVELLTKIFKDENKPDDSEERGEMIVPPEEIRKREHAYQLLRDFMTIPGGDVEGKVDPEKLRAWINKSRVLAKAEGRLKVCDSKIGQILANSGDAEDGSWPIIAVRDMVEEIASDNLDNGFFVGVMNRRGPTWRAITEGGNPTRALADMWEKHAQASKVKWPRIYSALTAVASRYRADAAREDEETERRI